MQGCVQNLRFCKAKLCKQIVDLQAKQPKLAAPPAAQPTAVPRSQTFGYLLRFAEQVAENLQAREATLWAKPYKIEDFVRVQNLLFFKRSKRFGEQAAQGTKNDLQRYALTELRSAVARIL